MYVTYLRLIQTIRNIYDDLAKGLLVCFVLELQYVYLMHWL